MRIRIWWRASAVDRWQRWNYMVNADVIESPPSIDEAHLPSKEIGDSIIEGEYP